MAVLPRFGVETTFVDGTKVGNFVNEIRKNTAVIYLESPNSFLFEMQDLQAIAELARTKSITTIIDNSYATPLHQKPAKLGIDLVLHTASKYLSGHSDVVSGVICGTSEMIRKIFASEFMTLGGIISPFDAWLMIRGLRTLSLRLEQSTRSALQVIGFLENQPLVERIFYPFHKSNLQLELAKKQMKAANGMFTVAFRATSKEKVVDFCNQFDVFKMAVSWGGHESLISPVVAFPGSHDNTSLPWNLVRFYVGLDEPGLLIDDLKKALRKLK